MYMYAHIHTYMHMCTCTYLYVYMYICMYMYVYTHVYMYMHTRMYPCMCVCMYAYIQICIHIYKYVRIYMLNSRSRHRRAQPNLLVFHKGASCSRRELIGGCVWLSQHESVGCGLGVLSRCHSAHHYSRLWKFFREQPQGQCILRPRQALQKMG